MKARYELGSLKMLELEMVLCGAVVGSVQPAPTRPARAAAMLRTAVVRFMFPFPLEPDAEAGGDRACARVNVVVDPVQACRGIHAAVPGDGERILYRAVQADRLTMILEAIADRDVVHPQERCVLDVIIRKVLRRDEPGLQH